MSRSVEERAQTCLEGLRRLQADRGAICLALSGPLKFITSALAKVLIQPTCVPGELRSSRGA